jgi:hypothetical protein
MEIEEQNQLHFLDVLIYKKSNGTLGHTIFRKETHTNRYLNANSHHHPAQIYSVVNTLVTRVKKLTDETHRQCELNNLRTVLTQNNFSNTSINKAINQKPKTNTEHQDEGHTKIFLPYIKGTTDKIQKTLKKHKIKTVFTADRKISNVLRNPKDIIALEDQGVYEIPCYSCPSSYIGQTNRRINIRRDEHKNAVLNKDTTSSLTQHVLTTGHEINFSDTKVVAKIQHYTQRIIREAIEIEKRPLSLNKRDDALRLPRIWRPTLFDRRVQQRFANTTINETIHTPNIESTSRPYTRSQAKIVCQLPL